MKFVLLLLVALCLPFAGCQSSCDCNGDCQCVDCNCVNCDCDCCSKCDCNGNCQCVACNCSNCDCYCCDQQIRQKVDPIDDSNKAYVTVFGDAADSKYQQLCQWGRQTAGVHYAEISTDNPLFARYSNQIDKTPRIVIQSPDGKVLYKGNPATYGEWRNRFNNNCPDGSCRPRPEPAPAPAPAPAPSPAVEPVPDTPESPSTPIWLMIVAGLGGAVAGSVNWWKQKYFAK